jgi:hypothetical protein
MASTLINIKLVLIDGEFNILFLWALENLVNS